MNDRLFFQYEQLVYQQAHHFVDTHIQIDDLVQEGYLALWKAVITYEYKHSSFITYATHCVKNQLISYTIKNKKYMRLEIDVPVVAYTYDDNIPPIFVLKLQGYTIQEIADIYGKSKSWVNRKLKEIRETYDI